VTKPSLTIVSPDDHVFEPPNLWSDRLPRRYRGIGPRVELLPEAEATMGPAGQLPERPSSDGRICSWWRYEDHFWMMRRYHAAPGFEVHEIGRDGITFDDMREGCWNPKARLDDMDINGVAASLCFPNYSRFAGQLFLNGRDKELSLLCVKAYNDWMVEEWAGGSGGRLIPLCMSPLWDVELAAAEVRRNAARGVRAVTFSELPPWIGLPSIHSGYWDPFFQACDETATVICMHIGSGTKMVQSSADSPPAIQGTLIFVNSCTALLDYLHSDILTRYPKLKLFFAECQIGWIPYVLERADDVWRTHTWSAGESRNPEPPSAVYRDRIYSCFFKDAVGVQMVEHVGVDQTMFETDYPHADGTWPRSQAVAEETFRGISEDVVIKLLRTNAIRLFDLDPNQIGLG
jgi:predicted TIM-barrel fold metal-dependent hydrolase